MWKPLPTLKPVRSKEAPVPWSWVRLQGHPLGLPIAQETRAPGARGVLGPCACSHVPGHVPCAWLSSSGARMAEGCPLPPSSHLCPVPRYHRHFPTVPERVWAPHPWSCFPRVGQRCGSSGKEHSAATRGRCPSLKCLPALLDFPHNKRVEMKVSRKEAGAWAGGGGGEHYSIGHVPKILVLF